MKNLFEYICEAWGSNYDEFMKRIKNAKSKNGKGLIFQFINNDGASDFTNEIGRYSSMIIPYNVKNTYSFIKFKSVSSQAPVDKFIKILKGKQVDEYEFTSSGFPYRGPVTMEVNHKYTVKVFQFDVEDATKLSGKQLSFIEPPNMYFDVSTSGFFGIASIDKNYIWDVVKKYL